MEETSLDLQEKFLADAKENKLKVQRQIEVEEKFIADLAGSLKYEDRQKRIRSEKVLKLYQETFGNQAKEVEDGLKVRDTIRENIARIEESWRFIKGR